MALRSSKITSSLVAETIKALKELSMFNNVRLFWISGHSDIPGNETADQFAKQAVPGSESRFRWTGACTGYTYNEDSQCSSIMGQRTTA